MAKQIKTKKKREKREKSMKLHLKDWTFAEGVWIHGTNTWESNQEICIWLQPVSSGVFISVRAFISDLDSLKIQLNPIKSAVLPCQQCNFSLSMREKKMSLRLQLFLLAFSKNNQLFFFYIKIADYSWKRLSEKLCKRSII